MGLFDKIMKNIASGSGKETGPINREQIATKTVGAPEKSGKEVHYTAFEKDENGEDIIAKYFFCVGEKYYPAKNYPSHMEFAAVYSESGSEEYNKDEVVVGVGEADRAVEKVISNYWDKGNLTFGCDINYVSEEIYDWYVTATNLDGLYFMCYCYKKDPSVKKYNSIFAQIPSSLTGTYKEVEAKAALQLAASTLRREVM